MPGELLVERLSENCGFWIDLGLVDSVLLMWTVWSRHLSLKCSIMAKRMREN